MIELVIFDCDGVLVDSEILAAQATSEVLGEIGLPMSAAAVLTELVGLDSLSANRRLEALHGAPLPPDLPEKLALRLAQAFDSELRPVPGTADLLRGLDLPFCVASNSDHARLRRSFSVTGLAKLVAGRVYSAEEVAQGKPAPDLFLHAARSMGGVPPRHCLVIEDSITGVTAARAAGMRVAGFCGAGHIGPGHAERLLALGAERILTSHRESTDFIRLARGNSGHRPDLPLLTPEEPRP